MPMATIGINTYLADW